MSSYEHRISSPPKVGITVEYVPTDTQEMAHSGGQRQCIHCNKMKALTRFCGCNMSMFKMLLMIVGTLTLLGKSFSSCFRVTEPDLFGSSALFSSLHWDHAIDTLCFLHTTNQPWSVWLVTVPSYLFRLLFVGVKWA